MKKTLLALALMGAMAGTASADQVTMYGVIDLGLDFTSIAGDHNEALQGVSDSTLTMGSGQNAGNRFGLKGTEDLGNGVTVGFVLENGFNADDGTLGQSDRLFGREAQLYVQSQYGTLAFGRMSMLSLDAGSYGLGGNLSSFGTGWGSYIGSQALVFATSAGRADNMITYKSPTMYGVTVYGQYSFQVNTQSDNKALEKEGKTTAERCGSLGATYEYGGVGLTGIFEYTDKANNANTAGHGKDTMAFTLGASYDCGIAKTYIAGQYFKDASWIGGSDARDEFGIDLSKTINGKKYLANDIDGYGIVVSTSIPVWGGDALATVGYMDADSDKTNKEVTRWMVGAGYQYPLSKRTLIYGGAGYLQDKVDNTSPSLVEVVAGMKHTF